VTRQTWTAVVSSLVFIALAAVIAFAPIPFVAWTPGVTYDVLGASDGKTLKIPNGVLYELQRLYYECATATYPAPMAALRAFAPPTQYLFGTDFPVVHYEATMDPLAELKLPSDVAYALDRGNAERLWPRFKV